MLRFLAVGTSTKRTKVLGQGNHKTEILNLWECGTQKTEILKYSLNT